MSWVRFIGTLILLVVCGGCQPATRFEFTQPKMGTLFHLVLYARDQPAANLAASAAWARVDELNAIVVHDGLPRTGRTIRPE